MFRFSDDLTDILPRKLCSVILIVLLFQMVHGTCLGAGTDSGSQHPLRVFVSILPIEFFVERIGGERVLVEALVQPGYSPATYAPTPKQMARMAASHLYFKVGVPFENSLLPKLARTLPELSIIDLQKNIDLIQLHGDSTHGHHEGEIDPHTWLDPMLALEHAIIIRDSLIELDPDGKEYYASNFKKVAADLEDIHLYLNDALHPLAGSTVFVFHPAYGYFCKAYNLRQKSITPGSKEPGAKHIARLIELAKKEKVQVIFVQTQFSDKAARTIARAIGANVVALDPLARDYLTNLKTMARQIMISLSEHSQ